MIYVHKIRAGLNRDLKKFFQKKESLQLSNGKTVSCFFMSSQTCASDSAFEFCHYYYLA